ncbi:DEAD/DEAH box helicase [Robertmurraya kyonggiensis]|uniref:DEAD/DEAH box helicase n=1 Tax=Robertmurraya kyonggiensis TaxID=1037680 RepID=A0A4U1DB92_9BACI|nr:DEAD/DEAH box helicase [Robertmurraya kyonggiensis]TKC19313.1 DEAD/DEAH box helicase [Robertmurraya kyonggiensis]
MADFLSLGISKKVVEQLAHNGIVIPTPIQEAAIPHVLKNKDIIAQAQTGTGKTLAFLLPVLEKIVPDSPDVQALIVTPTRELALQITSEVKKLIEDMDGVEALAVYGGQDVEKQLKKLKRYVQIVVGTPGRLLDHIRRETLSLGNISFLVLDEADQMLHIGFLNEVEDIIRETPRTRQTMLFSATMPDEIKTLAKKHMNAPVNIQVEKKQGPALSVKQLALHTTDRAKQGTIIELIETHRPYLAVIFCRTKRRVTKLFGILKTHGFLCDELHGDLSQAKREQVMKRFRDGEVQLLIATDVAARGLDVEGVTHVFNYDIPLDAESYVHRIGRTGRAGMKGLAITFYSSADRPTLDLIEKELNIRIPKQNIGNVETKGPKEERKQQQRGSKSKPREETRGEKGRPSKRTKEQGSKQRDGRRTEEKKHRDSKQKGNATASKGRRNAGSKPGTKPGAKPSNSRTTVKKKRR